MTNHIMILCSTAFFMGLFGGVHCIGMCGGIVCSLCHGCQKPSKRLWQQLSYQLAFNLGRILTYTVIGGFTGFLGVLINRHVGILNVYFLRYFTSILVVMVGLYIAGWWQWMSAVERLGQRIWRPISQSIRCFIPIKTLRHALFLGHLWGFLPCGLIYSALLFSLSANSWILGAMIMFCFGIGTLPALILVGSSMHLFQSLSSKRGVRQLMGLTMICFGLAALLFAVFNANQPTCHTARIY